MRRLWLVIVDTILILSIVISVFSFLQPNKNSGSQSNGVFFGVTYGSNTTIEAKLLIDKVKDYTNLFIVDSYPLTTNETSLNEVCNYAVNRGLSIIVYFSFISHVIYPWQTTWLDNAKEKWGDKFLGIYIYDEPGGKQIDLGAWNNETALFGNLSTTERDYDQAANIFNASLSNSQSIKDLKTRGITAFTSDYALYWFDYQAGYDVVFAELGELRGTTKLQAISLCRGAANMQGKEWGAIITYTYSDPPYLENGLVMLNDMLTAYFSGAKYIVVFNYPKYPESNQYGILSSDQLAAMKEFWTQIHSTEVDIFGTVNGQVALVLPRNFGSGLRSTTDRVWGVWSADDNLSSLIWSQMDYLTKKYGVRLDIVYDDSPFNLEGKYPTIYYWNSISIK